MRKLFRRGASIVCFIFAVAVIFVSAQIAFAQTYAKDGKTWDGVPLERVITIRVRDDIFGIPMAYLGSWPLRTELEKKEAEKAFPEYDAPDGFGIIFWMPDKSPVNYRTIPPGVYPYGTDRMDIETRRTKYQVVAQNIQFGVLASEPNDNSARRRIGNLERMKPNAAIINELFGLARYEYSIGNFVNRPFMNKVGEEPALIIQCFEEAWMPNPGCHGYVHFKDIDLGFFIRIPRQELRSWRESVEAVREFAIKYRKLGYDLSSHGSPA